MRMRIIQILDFFFLNKIAVIVNIVTPLQPSYILK